jgi:hypothetical protein
MITPPAATSALPTFATWIVYLRKDAKEKEPLVSYGMIR